MTLSELFALGVGGYFSWGPGQGMISSTAARFIIGISSAVLSLVIAYLLGSINFAILISKKKYHTDIRSYGSGNAGMTNMMRTFGTSAAALTLLGDALKAVLSGLCGYLLFGNYGAYIAGLFCIFGHLFPIYYKFKGGKGVVTAAIAILMCNPIVFACILLLFVLVVLATRYISLGSIMSALLYPILLDRITRLFNGNVPPDIIELIAAFLISATIIVMHRENIKRLLRGEERKFSFKKSRKSADETEKEKK